MNVIYRMLNAYLNCLFSFSLPIKDIWLYAIPVEELMKLGITDNRKGQFDFWTVTLRGTSLFFQLISGFLMYMMFLTEVDLQHSAIWMAGVYLMLLMQFLENKVALELTRSEFVEAQEVACMPILLHDIYGL